MLKDADYVRVRGVNVLTVEVTLHEGLVEFSKVLRINADFDQF